MTMPHSMQESQTLQEFLSFMKKNRPVFWPSIEKNREKDPYWFPVLGNILTKWAKDYLGESYIKILADSYVFFTTEVNRAQVNYENEGCYPNSCFEDVYNNVYNNKKYMQSYHWGVYTATFAWNHHVAIYRFFCEHFLPLFSEKTGFLAELGCGSGIWSFFFLSKFQSWNGKGIDISETSVHMAEEMASIAGVADRMTINVGDALKQAENEIADAAISCLLLEHLEKPEKLLQSLYQILKPGGMAFITAALTAAEPDHIKEFKWESQIVEMAEKCGFRLKATYSSSPPDYPDRYKYLPRSMALVIQKRMHDFW